MITVSGQKPPFEIVYDEDNLTIATSFEDRKQVIGVLGSLDSKTPSGISFTVFLADINGRNFTFSEATALNGAAQWNIS